MTVGLQAFAERDAGFRQFNERYEHIAADPTARQEYASWFNETLRQKGMLDGARQEGQEKGWEEARGEYEPKLAASEQKRQRAEQKFQRAEQKLLTAAKTMKNQGVPIETLALAFPSLASELETL